MTTRIFLLLIYASLAYSKLRSQNEYKEIIILGGFEQLYHGNINSGVSLMLPRGYHYHIHTLHLAYSPWGGYSQLYYGYDIALLGIGISANGGIISDFKNVSPFLRPEFGLSLGVFKAMIGYNFPLMKNDIGNYKCLSFKIYIGIHVNRKEHGVRTIHKEE